MAKRKKPDSGVKEAPTLDAKKQKIETTLSNKIEAVQLVNGNLMLGYDEFNQELVRLSKANFEGDLESTLLYKLIQEGQYLNITFMSGSVTSKSLELGCKILALAGARSFVYDAQGGDCPDWGALVAALLTGDSIRHISLVDTGYSEDSLPREKINFAIRSYNNRIIESYIDNIMNSCDALHSLDGNLTRIIGEYCMDELCNIDIL